MGRPAPTRSSSKAKGNREKVLTRMMALIKKYPGIRPSELNRHLGMTQSDALRAVLLRRGLVRKVKDGRATHLFPK